MAKKYVYLFKEGNANMRELLGGKGANLAEMTNLGMPVPQGFTVTTEACTRYYTDGKVIGDDIVEQIYAAFPCFCPLRRSCLHARHDGYHSESGPDGRVCCGSGEPDQQPAFRV